MNKLTYDDGTVVEFEDFKVNAGMVQGVTMPAVSGKGRGYSSAQIYMRPEDHTIRANARNGRMTKTETDKIRVGVLRDATNHPFPKGIYVPYRISNWGDMSHAMDGLYGDFIFNDDIADKAAVAKLKENEES